MNSKQKTINGSSGLLTLKANEYAHAVYLLSNELPRDELFGLTSQLKRSALSVPLNIIEGYARQSAKSEAQFLKIAYGSLKESLYILQFAVEENLISADETARARNLGNETARLVWRKTQSLRIKQSAQA